MKTFFSIIYRFSEYFPLNSKTRECAEAIEGSEISVHNFAERENPTLISNCKLVYYMLKHFHPVIDRCSYSILDELIRKQTYLSFENFDERIATFDHLFQQDQRVYTNLQEVVRYAKLEEVDYDEIGWYIGDSLGRLILRPVEHEF